MEEYRESEAETEHIEQPASENPQSLGYMSLAAQYGLGDEMEIGGSTSSRHQASVEEEYLSYIMANLSPASMDILKFWEVSLWTSANSVTVESA